MDVKSGAKAAEGFLRAVSDKRVAPLTLISGPNAAANMEFALWATSLLLCLSANKPCGECSACKKLSLLAHESLLKIEPEKGSIKVEQAHQMLEFLRLRPWSGNQVVVIESAHLMTTQSANALLKSFEEPPPSTYFFLVAEQSRMVLPTIRSRSQKIFLSAPAIANAVEEEKVLAYTDLLNTISRGEFSKSMDQISELSIDKAEVLPLLLSWQKTLTNALKSQLHAPQSSTTQSLRLISESFKEFRGPADWSLLLHALTIKLNRALAGVQFS